MSPPPDVPRCPGCRLFEDLCLCAEIPRIETRREFLIVRHHVEATRNSNTARLIEAALVRSRVLDYGRRGEPFDDRPLRVPAWLVFPSERDHQGEETGRHRLITGDEEEPPGTLILLDGSWGQARRMSHRIAALDALPRYVLGPPASAPARLRRSHDPAAMSTIEAVARLIERFESPPQAHRLDALHAEFVRRHRARGRRSER